MSPGYLYLVKLSGGGDPYAVRSFTGAAELESVGVGLDQKLGLVTAGSFQKTLDYGYGTLESPGGWDVFVSHSE